MAFDKTIALAKLIDELKSVNGRKRLQKIVHLLRSAPFKEFDYDFVLYYYGPFSRELATDLDFLCKAQLVRESQPASPETDNTYRYEVNEEKSRIIQNLGQRGSGQSSTRPRWSQLAATLNKENTPFLEAVSTVVYLARTGLGRDRLEMAFKRAKPRLSRCFDRALAFAGKQNLTRQPGR